MLRTVDLRGRQLEDYSPLLPRASFDVEDAMAVVQPICRAVHEEGVAALERYSQQFDRVVPPSFRVPPAVIEAAVRDLDPGLREAILEAIARRRRVATEVELEPSFRSVELAPGARVGYMIRPVERVGLYVPGGLAPLASSVLMNVVPAQVAGVTRIAVATPPQLDFDGWPHPTILAVCGLLGVEEVYAVGGAQAVAMFARGVPGLCRRVDLVTGPGNIYVVAAKRAMRPFVGIDSEAGPTEIAILADSSADPALVAADLISQAEHDPLAAAVLVTDDTELAAAVQQQVELQVPQNPLHERLLVSLGSQQSGIVLVDDLEQGLRVVDDYAAEHLEIHTRQAGELARRVHNAGAIFVGPFSPVPLGDYSAGSTHVLPTSGTARFSSGLTVRSFCKAVHLIEYSAEGLAAIGDGIEDFAHAERLPGHARAIALRTRPGQEGAGHE